MELKEIAVVSGKSGLFKIVKPAVNGVILEALDSSSFRFIANSSTKVSVLGEISVYTEGGENIPLEEVFRIIYAKHGKTLKVNSKSSDNDLRTFFTDLIPEHDKIRVYTSDIKKIAVWFGLLLEKGFEEKFSTKQTNEVTTEVSKTKKTSTKEEDLISEKPKKDKTTKVVKKETVAAEENKTGKKV